MISRLIGFRSYDLLAVPIFTPLKPRIKNEHVYELKVEKISC